MTLLLYAIADRDHVISDAVTGIGGEPMQRLVEGDLTAIVGECPATPEPTPDALLRFEQTVEGLMGDETVLPARFGTTVPDEPAGRKLLAERHNELTEALARVRGAVELGVRAGWPDETVGAERPTGPNAGSDYMLRRLEHQRRARRIADEIDAALGDLSRERACRILARPESQVSASYLVARPRVEEFLVRCHALADTVTSATVVCTGPWPPYSFVAGASA